MVSTPMSVPHRPFAVEPITEMMMPDGIFDTSIFVQRITAQVKNTSSRDLINVDIYLEGISDPAIVPTPFTHQFPRVPAGATVTVAWIADFQNAGPGKPVVSIVAQEAGSDIARSIKRIFVSRTSYDEVQKKFTCEVPEGRLEMTNLTAFEADGSSWEPPPECEPDDDDNNVRINPGPYLPVSFDAVFIPNPPYTGTHGELPFNDPLWKVIGWIIFGIATTVGVILAATSKNKDEKFFTGVKGTFDETSTINPAITCCKPDWKTVIKKTGFDKVKVTGAGVASAIATGALIPALADDEDPWRRGQRATAPDSGVLTIAEIVNAKIKYIDPPNAGLPYTVGTEWKYTRQTTAGTESYSVSEERENTHLAQDVIVTAPSPHNAFQNPLEITLKVLKPDGNAYAGPELFAFALLISPDRDFSAVISLFDNGISPDTTQNDGTYTGSIHLDEVYPIMRRKKQTFEGRWKILAFAQDVNLANENDLPEIQAQTIGGFVVASPITINFDTSLPCPIKAQAEVEVII